jgi:hypothetical protein
VVPIHIPWGHVRGCSPNLRSRKDKVLLKTVPHLQVKNLVAHNTEKIEQVTNSSICIFIKHKKYSTILAAKDIPSKSEIINFNTR